MFNLQAYRTFLKFKEILNRYGIIQNNISFDKFDDDSICIEFDRNGNIMIYSVDRGNVFDYKKYYTVKDAYCDVICRVTSTTDEEEKVMHDFLALIK